MLSAFLTSVLAAPSALDAKIVGASMFKNGYAAVFRQAPVTQSGEYVIKNPPGSSLGALWFTASENVRFESVVAGTETTQVDRPASDLAEVLSLNEGKTVSLEVASPGDRAPSTLQGTLISSKGALAVVRTSSGDVAIPKSQVLRVMAGGLTYSAKATSSEPVLRLKVTVRGTNPGTIMLMTLQRGLSWAPAYAVDISDEKQLTLTAKATIINDLGDLNGIECRLITGFPNIRFLTVLDPLTSRQSLDQFLASLGGSPAMPGGGGMSQNMRRAMEAAPADMAGGWGEPPAEGFQAEDLFFYRQPGVQLKTGERGYYVLFQSKAEYRQVYTSVLTDPQQLVAMPNPQDSPPDVWHTLRFKNTASQPLTTAAATTMKNGEMLGQDMLNYTSPGAETELKITKALDIRVEQKAEEVARETAVRKNAQGRPTHDMVTLKGEVMVENRKGKAAALSLRLPLVGEVTMASENGKIVKTAMGLNQLNPSSLITWTPTLESGKSLKLTYTVRVLVPTE